MRKHGLNPRVRIDEIHRTGSRIGYNTEVISDRKSEKNVPSVFVAGLSPLEMSAFRLNLGFSGSVGTLYPVSEANVQARIFADPKLPNCQTPS